MYFFELYPDLKLYPSELIIPVTQIIPSLILLPSPLILHIIFQGLSTRKYEQMLFIIHQNKFYSFVE